jgi:hypothetical protein
MNNWLRDFCEDQYRQEVLERHMGRKGAIPGQGYVCNWEPRRYETGPRPDVRSRTWILIAVPFVALFLCFASLIVYYYSTVGWCALC